MLDLFMFSKKYLIEEELKLVQASSNILATHFSYCFDNYSFELITKDRWLSQRCE